MAAAERRRLDVIAGLGRRLDAGRVHDRHHEGDRFLRPRHDRKRSEGVARRVRGDVLLGQQLLQELQIFLEMRLGFLDRDANSAGFKAKGTLADTQHQPAVAQSLRLHYFAREYPHIPDRQLTDSGDELQANGCQ